MNYELTKKLKEAGFPIRKSPYSIERARIRDMHDGMGNLVIFDGDETVFYEPTLSELIEACGKYVCLVQDEEGWCAHYSVEPFEAPVGLDAIDTFMCKREFGSTPEEAVANLWLKLNEK